MSIKKSAVTPTKLLACLLNRQVRTSKRRTSAASIISHDSLHSSIQPRPQQEKSTNHNKDMNNSHDTSLGTSEKLSTVHLPIRQGKEDEPEEGIKCCSQQGQEISHTGDDLGKDESEEPEYCHDRYPYSPSNDGVGMGVTGGSHDAAEDEFGRDICVDHSNDQSGHNDKRKRRLLVSHNTQTSECWCSGVLSKISEPDGRRNDEQESGNACQDCQGLGEVLWSFHLVNERRKKSLWNPEECDVEDLFKISATCLCSFQEGSSLCAKVCHMVAMKMHGSSQR
jgi:hypothetical protein